MPSITPKMSAILSWSQKTYDKLPNHVSLIRAMHVSHKTPPSRLYSTLEDRSPHNRKLSFSNAKPCGLNRLREPHIFFPIIYFGSIFSSVAFMNYLMCVLPEHPDIQSTHTAPNSNNHIKAEKKHG